MPTWRTSWSTVHPGQLGTGALRSRATWRNRVKSASRQLSKRGYSMRLTLPHRYDIHGDSRDRDQAQPEPGTGSAQLPAERGQGRRERDGAAGPDARPWTERLREPADQGRGDRVGTEEGQDEQRHHPPAQLRIGTELHPLVGRLPEEDLGEPGRHEHQRGERV